MLSVNAGVHLLASDREGDGLACDRGVWRRLWAGVRLRADDVDEQGEGARLQAAVRRLRERQAATHRRPHRLKLQPPGATVSSMQQQVLSSHRTQSTGATIHEH